LISQIIITIRIHYIFSIDFLNYNYLKIIYTIIQK